MRALDINNPQCSTNKLVEDPNVRRQRGRTSAHIVLETAEWAQQENECQREDGRRKLSLLKEKIPDS